MKRRLIASLLVALLVLPSMVCAISDATNYRVFIREILTPDLLNNLQTHYTTKLNEIIDKFPGDSLSVVLVATDTLTARTISRIMLKDPLVSVSALDSLLFHLANFKRINADTIVVTGSVTTDTLNVTGTATLDTLTSTSVAILDTARIDSLTMAKGSKAYISAIAHDTVTVTGNLSTDTLNATGPTTVDTITSTSIAVLDTSRQDSTGIKKLSVFTSANFTGATVTGLTETNTGTIGKLDSLFIGQNSKPVTPTFSVAFTSGKRVHARYAKDDTFLSTVRMVIPVFSSSPSASIANKGALYFNTTDSLLYRCVGATWVAQQSKDATLDSLAANTYGTGTVIEGKFGSTKYHYEYIQIHVNVKQVASASDQIAVQDGSESFSGTSALLTGGFFTNASSQVATKAATSAGDAENNRAFLDTDLNCIRIKKMTGVVPAVLMHMVTSLTETSVDLSSIHAILAYVNASDANFTGSPGSISIFLRNSSGAVIDPWSLVSVDGTSFVITVSGVYAY